MEKARREVDGVIRAEGERAVLETGVRGLHPELQKLLGKLHYRTSYGQNVLQHSIEVSHIARPGARRENLENYIKRLEKLEEITGSYPGVEKSYAIQAGREVRVMVKPEQVSEDEMVILARELAKRIESELEYPGQIKVHVLRETKVVEYAK